MIVEPTQRFSGHAVSHVIHVIMFTVLAGVCSGLVIITDGGMVDDY